MSKGFVQIHGLKSNLESEDENLVRVKFGNESVHHISFSKLKDKHNISETIVVIKNKIYEIEETMQIKEESIKLFIQFFQNEKISIPIDQFRDVYILSEFFNIAILTHELDNVGQKEFFNDLNILIQMLQNLNTFKVKIETSLINKIENALSSRINECFKNPKFSHLPVSTIYKILSVTDKEDLNANLLVDFIADSVDSLFVLFDFVEIQKVPTDKLEEIIKLNSGKTKERPIQKPLLANIAQIKQMKNKNSEGKNIQKPPSANNVQNKQVKSKSAEEKNIQKPPSVNNVQNKQMKSKNVEERSIQKPPPVNNVQIKQMKSKNAEEQNLIKLLANNNIQIKQMKKKKDNLILQVSVSRNEIEETKQEISRTKLELEKTKQEMRQAKEEMERLKKQMPKKGKK